MDASPDFENCLAARPAEGPLVNTQLGADGKPVYDPVDGVPCLLAWLAGDLRFCGCQAVGTRHGSLMMARHARQPSQSLTVIVGCDVCPRQRCRRELALKNDGHHCVDVQAMQRVVGART